MGDLAVPNTEAEAKLRMEINTNRLRLRPYRLQDLEQVHAFQGDAEALIYEPWGPNSLVEVRQMIEQTSKMALAFPWKLEMVIELLDSGHVIGGCRMELPATKQRGWATIGYVMQRDFWGRGYATEATNGLIAYARTHSNVIGVRAISDSHNIPSLRVLEKCGMERVGMIAETEEVKGRFRDMLKYELRF